MYPILVENSYPSIHLRFAHRLAYPCPCIVVALAFGADDEYVVGVARVEQDGDIGDAVETLVAWCYYC